MTGIPSIVPHGSFLYPSRPPADSAPAAESAQGAGSVQGAASVQGADSVHLTASAQGAESAQAEQNKAGQDNREAKANPVRPAELSQQERMHLAELQRVDAQVKAHEMAHLGASGGHATSGAKFEYTTGPDGKRYAVGGEVGIDTSPVRDNPQATAAKARTIRAAALAPANPSGADRAVAAAASQMEAQAMGEIMQERRLETQTLDSERGQELQVGQFPHHNKASGQDNPFQATAPPVVGQHLDTLV